MDLSLGQFPPCESYEDEDDVKQVMDEIIKMMEYRESEYAMNLGRGIYVPIETMVFTPERYDQLTERNKLRVDHFALTPLERFDPTNRIQVIAKLQDKCKHDGVLRRVCLTTQDVDSLPEMYDWDEMMESKMLAEVQAILNEEDE